MVAWISVISFLGMHENPFHGDGGRIEDDYCRSPRTLNHPHPSSSPSTPESSSSTHLNHRALPPLPSTLSTLYPLPLYPVPCTLYPSIPTYPSDMEWVLSLIHI